MLPQVVDQTLIQLFRYWQDGIRVGMVYAGELYTCFRSYPSNSRSHAFDLGCHLASSEIHTCITRSPFDYTVWISLRSAPESLADASNSAS